MSFATENITDQERIAQQRISDVSAATINVIQTILKSIHGVDFIVVNESDLSSLVPTQGDKAYVAKDDSNQKILRIFEFNGIEWIDLKSINDFHNHPEIDAVLNNVTDIVQTQVQQFLDENGDDLLGDAIFNSLAVQNSSGRVEIQAKSKNFIGTTDNTDFHIVSNASDRVSLRTNGSIELNSESLEFYTESQDNSSILNLNRSLSFETSGQTKVHEFIEINQAGEFSFSNQLRFNLNNKDSLGSVSLLGSNVIEERIIETTGSEIKGAKLFFGSDASVSESFSITDKAQYNFSHTNSTEGSNLINLYDDQDLWSISIKNGLSISTSNSSSGITLSLAQKSINFDNDGRLSLGSDNLNRTHGFVNLETPRSENGIVFSDVNGIGTANIGGSISIADFKYSSLETYIIPKIYPTEYTSEALITIGNAVGSRSASFRMFGRQYEDQIIDQEEAIIPGNELFGNRYIFPVSNKNRYVNNKPLSFFSSSGFAFFDTIPVKDNSSSAKVTPLLELQTQNSLAPTFVLNGDIYLKNQRVFSRHIYFENLNYPDDDFIFFNTNYNETTDLRSYPIPKGTDGQPVYATYEDYLNSGLLGTFQSETAGIVTELLSTQYYRDTYGNDNAWEFINQEDSYVTRNLNGWTRDSKAYFRKITQIKEINRNGVRREYHLGSTTFEGLKFTFEGRYSSIASLTYVGDFQIAGRPANANYSNRFTKFSSEEALVEINSGNIKATNVIYEGATKHITANCFVRYISPRRIEIRLSTLVYQYVKPFNEDNLMSFTEYFEIYLDLDDQYAFTGDSRDPFLFFNPSLGTEQTTYYAFISPAAKGITNDVNYLFTTLRDLPSNDGSDETYGIPCHVNVANPSLNNFNDFQQNVNTYVPRFDPIYTESEGLFSHSLYDRYVTNSPTPINIDLNQVVVFTHLKQIRMYAYFFLDQGATDFIVWVDDEPNGRDDIQPSTQYRVRLFNEVNVRAPRTHYFTLEEKHLSRFYIDQNNISRSITPRYLHFQVVAPVNRDEQVQIERVGGAGPILSSFIGIMDLEYDYFENHKNIE